MGRFIQQLMLPLLLIIRIYAEAWSHRDFIEASNKTRDYGKRGGLTFAP